MDAFWPLSMMQGEAPAGYSSHPLAHQVPVEFHVANSHYPYYRKTGDDVQSQIGLNASFGADQQWRHPDGTIMEQRKEKSRDAARSRRGKENYEFYELAKMLPLPQAITSQLDKASIIRLTISYLKLKSFTVEGDPPWRRELHSNKGMKGSVRHRSITSLTMEMFEQHQGTHILQSLDGFAFSLAADARFLYISETVSIYLGLSQVEMTGSSVFDYIHTDDHQELAEQLCLTLTSGHGIPSPSSPSSDDNSASCQGTMNPDVLTGMQQTNTSNYKGNERAFCIRMKSTLTKRGCHFKSCSGFRVLLMLGHMRPHAPPPLPHSYVHTRKTPQILGFVGLAIALPPPSIHEIRLEPDMFVTRLNFDFTIAHCEPKASDLLDYQAEDLQGRSLYSLSHAEDVYKIKKTHEDLIKKGQVMSPYFRLLNKHAGYTWMQLCATVICNSKNSDDQNIICVNYIISPCQYKSLILDESQLDPLLKIKPDNIEYTTTVSPDATGEMPRVREESRHCPSPRGVSGTLCETNSPQSNAVPEVSVTPHRSSPDHSSDATMIKTEVPVNMLTPVTGNEMQEDSRMDHSDKQSSCNTVSSAPVTPQERAGSNNSLISTPILEVPNQIRSDEGSVKELEAAMTRHLPEETPDFSTDVLRNSSSGMHSSRSTIQWVGNGSQQSSLPASTLLRQLYANRESVIRTSVQRSYYPDVQAALPTPPGHDGYQESMFAKSHDFSYSNNGVSLANSVSSVGIGGTYADFHSAMTPPSSVSPREKMSTDCNDLRSASSYLGDLTGNIPTQHLPLKPQVYSYGHSAVGLDATAYPSSLADQPGGLYPSTSFHLYHTSPNKSSGAYDSLRTGASWYPSTS